MVAVNKTEIMFDEVRFKTFCKKNSFELPIAYVDYLAEYNDGELESNVVEIENNEINVRFFYGTSGNEYTDIIAVYDEYKERLPEKCIPIADPDFGNLVCMSLSDDTYGNIYFWDHETMDTEEDAECVISINDMYKIADSFEMLLNQIKESPYEFEMKEKKGLRNLLKMFSKNK